VPTVYDYERPPFPAPRLLKRQEAWEEVRILSKWLTSSCGTTVVAMRLCGPAPHDAWAESRVSDATFAPTSGIEWYFYVGKGEHPIRMRSTDWMNQGHGILSERLGRLTRLIRAESHKNQELRAARAALAQTLLAVGGSRRVQRNEGLDRARLLDRE
jgi:hypothetical protein